MYDDKERIVNEIILLANDLKARTKHSVTSVSGDASLLTATQIILYLNAKENTTNEL